MLARKFNLRGAVPQGITSQLFAIGNGDLVTRETYEFDQLIVSASGRTRPWTLCITAAADDSPEACNAFGNIYGDGLRCRTDYLRILKGEPGGDEFQRKIARNEVFYFSDGNLDLLVQAIDQYGIADHLREAYTRGAIFGGVGAGAAILGLLGFSGSTTSASGIGVADVNIGCIVEDTNFSATSATAAFKDKSSVPGFVLGHMTALNVKGDEFRVLSGQAGGEAHVIVKGQDSVVASSVEYAPLSSLASTKAKQRV